MERYRGIANRERQYPYNGTTTAPLPSRIPDEKLQEIGMIHPPFPPLHQLTYNFLLLPKSPEKIHEWVEIWQDNLRQLTAWIAQAKVKSAHTPSCSWAWPTAPSLSYPIPTPANSPHLTSCETKPEKGTSAHNSSVSGYSDPLFSENPEPPSKPDSLPYIFHHGLNYLPNTGWVARAFHTRTEKDSPKRARDSSPTTPNRDGEDANKKQLVLWRPTIAKVLEMEANLRRGEVSGYSTGLSRNPISSIRVRDPRLGTPNTFPSKHNCKPRLNISLLATDLTDVSDGSSASSSMNELF